jgi:hypothetical protein
MCKKFEAGKTGGGGKVDCRKFDAPFSGVKGGKKKPRGKYTSIIQ